jgi:sugar lactone lactonase YvrE
LGDLWRTDLTANTSEIVARFREPIDNLTIAADGTIYISNVADSAVYAYDPATGARRDVVVGYFTTALGMTWAPHRGRPQLLVADPFGYRFVDPTTGTVDRPFWAANRGASSAVAADARVIAWSYAGSGRVRVLDRQSDRLVVDSTAIKTPRGIVLVPDGGVIVADAEGGRLARVTAEGVSTVADGLRRPVGLTLDGAAAVLVTEFEAGTVSRVELATGRRTELARGLQRPAGVARMADGRIAVIEPAARRISAVTPGTGARTTLADALPLALDRLDVAQDSPVGIAVGPDGTVYASCPGDNSIVALAPTAPQTRRQ